jgi:putative hemolysin
MQALIAPVPVQQILQELNASSFLRTTNKGGNEIYIVNAHNAPNTIQEIGRLRELSFRASGGGTGNAVDLDEYDLGDHCYQQLIVWNPEEQEIVGGYRYIMCSNAIDSNGAMHLSTLKYFTFSDNFKANYLHKTIELGRSFVLPNYQNKDGNRKGLFSLDNLWDGLGALIVLHPTVDYFFGKVTMYPSFNQQARDSIVAFMHHYFPDNEQLLTALPQLKKDMKHDVSGFVNKLQQLPYKEGHLLLTHTVKELGENVPPLINSYMNLSATMKTFDTAQNNDFGGVEETGILIDIRDIYPTKKDRHMLTFVPQS